MNRRALLLGTLGALFGFRLATVPAFAAEAESAGAGAPDARAAPRPAELPAEGGPSAEWAQESVDGRLRRGARRVARRQRRADRRIARVRRRTARRALRAKLRSDF
jgi:hypothetical protein